MREEPETELNLKHDVRQRIMAAAEGLFGTKGYDATSISDISDAAGAGRALIYYYFTDKRQLYDSILRESGERIAANAEQASRRLARCTSIIRISCTSQCETNWSIFRRSAPKPGRISAWCFLPSSGSCRKASSEEKSVA